MQFQFLSVRLCVLRLDIIYFTHLTQQTKESACETSKQLLYYDWWDKGKENVKRMRGTFFSSLNHRDQSKFNSRFTLRLSYLYNVIFFSIQNRIIHRTCIDYRNIKAFSRLHSVCFRSYRFNANYSMLSHSNSSKLIDGLICSEWSSTVNMWNLKIWPLWGAIKSICRKWKIGLALIHELTKCKWSSL